MAHPLLQRAHLEALLVAHVLLDPGLIECVDRACLSSAADALCGYAAEENAGARISLQLAVEDEYQARLATRVDRLTLDELRWYPAATLVELVNQLPQLTAAIDVLRRIA